MLAQYEVKQQIERSTIVREEIKENIRKLVIDFYHEAKKLILGNSIDNSPEIEGIQEGYKRVKYEAQKLWTLYSKKAKKQDTIAQMLDMFEQGNMRVYEYFPAPSFEMDKDKEQTLDTLFTLYSAQIEMSAKSLAVLDGKLDIKALFQNESPKKAYENNEANTADEQPSIKKQKVCRKLFN